MVKAGDDDDDEDSYADGGFTVMMMVIECRLMAEVTVVMTAAVMLRA